MAPATRAGGKRKVHSDDTCEAPKQQKKGTRKDNNSGITKLQPQQHAACQHADGNTVEKQYFLLKSEPDEFSIDDLAARPDATAPWDGVRNFQARNILQSMRINDECFFYHSSCSVPSIVGTVRVVRPAYPDSSAFDVASKYYDAKSTRDAPRWFCVDVQLIDKLPRAVSLNALKSRSNNDDGGVALADMQLLTRPRLSVQRVTPSQWNYVLKLAASSPEHNAD